MDRPAEARATFAKLLGIARNTVERRTAYFWTAASYVREGEVAAALDEIRKSYALSEAEGDLATMAGDLNQMGDILREAGKPDKALEMYQQSIATITKAKVPDEVKAAAQRTMLFEEGRIAVARQDLATARARASEYGEQFRDSGSLCSTIEGEPGWRNWQTLGT